MTIKEIPVEDLEEMETISQGQFDDLKKHTGKLKYWVSRMTKEDGEEFKVTVERLSDYGRWETVHRYGRL